MQNTYSPYSYPMGGYMPMLTGNTMPQPTSVTTNQGQQLQSLAAALASITGQPNTPLTGAYDQVSADAQNLQDNSAAYANNIQQQNLSSAGVPGLESQYGNLAQMFQLWQAHQGLSTQYGNQDPNATMNVNSNPAILASAATNQGQMQAQNQADMAKVGNMTTGNQSATTAAPAAQPTPTQNPFLASTQAVVDSASNLPTPPAVLAARGQTPVNSTMDLMNLVNSLIGISQGNAQNATTTDVASYQDKMNTINNVANQLGTALQTQTANNQPGSAASVQSSLSSVKSDVNKGMTFTDLLNKYDTDPNMTAAKVLEIYNGKHATPGDKWGPAQITPEMADAYGLKQTQTNLAAKLDTKNLQKTKLSDGSMGSYDKTTGKYYNADGVDVSKQESGNIVSADQQIIDSAKKMRDELTKIPIYLRAGPLAAIGAHLNPDLAGAQALLMQNIGTLKKAIGGRVTQQELFKWLDAEFPSGKDFTPDVMNAKIDALEAKLNNDIATQGGTTSTPSTPTSGKTIQVGKYKVTY